MAFTVSQAIERTRFELLGSHRQPYNKLASSVADASTTSWTFTYNLGAIAAGTYLACQDEMAYVWEVDASTKTATVQRGVLGTTAASHASGSLVEVDHTFPSPRIRQVFREEIRSWPTSLFAEASTSLTGLSTDLRSQMVNFNVDFLDVIEVWEDPEGTSETRWVEVRDFRVVSKAPSGDFASTKALQIGRKLSVGTLHVVYAKPFDTSSLADAVDLEATVGLAPGMLDILVYGSAWRMQTGREATRSLTDSQGESRFAEEVPPGAVMRAGLAFKALRDSRINDEANRLRARYPIRFR